MLQNRRTQVLQRERPKSASRAAEKSWRVLYDICFRAADLIDFRRTFIIVFLVGKRSCGLKRRSSRFACA